MTKAQSDSQLDMAPPPSTPDYDLDPIFGTLLNSIGLMIEGIEVAGERLGYRSGHIEDRIIKTLNEAIEHYVTS